MGINKVKSCSSPPLDPKKFQNPHYTLGGERRATVDLTSLEILWFNTGTICNLACRNCYIHSSPTNDELVYLKLVEVSDFLNQISTKKYKTREVGFTGGEPFMNPELIDMVQLCLNSGFKVLVLTNAMKPMMHRRDELLALQARFPSLLEMRVSIDHYSRKKHQLERGENSWGPAVRGLKWLCDNGFEPSVAGRLCWSESESEMRSGYDNLFTEHELNIDAHDPSKLMLFPEMDTKLDVPEITENCWDSLGLSSEQVMCANSRMVLKRRDAARPSVVPCTLLADDPKFELGISLSEADRKVSLNHPHCARFCVLGGGRCSTV